MIKNILFALLAITSVTIGQAQMLDTARIQMTGLDGTVKISTDDAEQKNNEIDKLYDDDLDMGWEGDEFNVVITGLRFRGISVPRGSKIDSAFVVFFAHEDEGDLCILSIWAEAADDAKTFNETDLITARPKTTAKVSWNVTEPWTIWTPHRTPDLKSLIQEVVSRPGWKAENSLALVFSGTDQGASNQDNARDVESFENVADPDDGGDGLNHPERIPKLFIYYSPASGTAAPTSIGELSVTPNPVDAARFSVALPQFQHENVLISLHTLDGQLVNRWPTQSVQSASLDLTLGDVRSGMYVLEVVSAAHVGVAKLMVR